MTDLRDLELVRASVPSRATFVEAVAALAASRLSAIAILDARGVATGVFTQEAQLRGLFPEYLGELRHTAFLDDDPERLAERAREVRDEPVTRHATKAPTLAGGDSETHAAELFLHTGLEALPVFEGDRFLGMLERRTLCEAAVARLGL